MELCNNMYICKLKTPMTILEQLFARLNLADWNSMYPEIDLLDYSVMLLV